MVSKSGLLGAAILVLVMTPISQPLFANDVLVVVPENTGDEISDSVGALDGTGLLNSVDAFNVFADTPSLSDLQAYSSLAVWNNSLIDDPEGLGNVLAEYVDIGGAVVIMNAAGMHDNSINDFGIEGNFVSGGYLPIVQNGGINQENNISLGTVHDPSHPIMQNVNTIGDDSIIWDGTVEPFGTVIADWDIGYPLVVEHNTEAVVYVNVFFYSSDHSSSYGYDPNSDVALMVANALNYTESVARQSSPRISSTPDTLSFQAPEEGSDPASQSVELTVTSGPQSWNATATEPWVSVSPPSGSSSETLSISVETDGLEEGTHQAVVEIDAGATIGSPQSIAISFEITEAEEGNGDGNGNGGSSVGSGSSGCGMPAGGAPAAALLWLFAALFSVGLLRRLGRVTV